MFTPKSQNNQEFKVQKIVVGSFYVSPNSSHKKSTIDHIIETIHFSRSLFECNIHYLLGGDFNRLNINAILDSFGALKQFVSVPTRNKAILEIVLTDLHPFYHPPTTLPPLQVDTDKNGADSDHNVVVLAPLNNSQFKIDRVKKSVTIRPIPDSKILSFGAAITQHNWSEVFGESDLDKKVTNFHSYIRKLVDEHFPEKVVKISSLDKKWMSPTLKVMHRRTQREFVKHRKSKKWKKLNRAYKKMKRKSVKSYYSNFVNELKQTNPGKWYEMAKRIGAVDQMNAGEIKVEALGGLSNKQSAQKIAEHFSSVSHQYSPVDHSQLPSYLPAQQLPKIDEHDVYVRLKRMKNTKSTLPIDIPDRLRKEFSVELAAPLTNIILACLENQVYPKLWKNEWVTPAPKISNPKILKDLRKISCTSTFSKLFEGILKDWIVEDITENMDIGQFGGEKGTGTEHMIVCLIDRILQLLDKNSNQSAVIAAFVDWAAAFDHQDPTLAIKRFIEIGVRPAIIPILVSYLSERQMRVKFNGEESEIMSLIGGGPQGTLLGQLMYLVQSNDNANVVEPEDRFKYIDDLSILQIVCLAGLLASYNFHFHVASDVGVDQLFLPPSNCQTQSQLDEITEWTRQNLMKLNEAKSNYMIFKRTKSNFVTRLNLNGTVLDQLSTTKLLGIWITEDLSWAKNTQQFARRLILECPCYLN